MSGANVSPIGRNNKVMPGANLSPIGRNKEEWFLSRTAITGGFRPRNHPARRIKRRRATPPNLGGEFHSDASRHSGNLIASAGDFRLHGCQRAELQINKGGNV